jgi:spermidine synthase
MKQNNENRLILILFFASGISGLIYEIVWLRMLTRIVGVTTYATSITLAAFMAGLGLGSFIFGKFADKRNDSLKTYALLQLSISIIALIAPFVFKAFVPLYTHSYRLSGQNMRLIMALRALLPFTCLLIPATLMGGTLPVLTSYMAKKTKLFGKSFSLLYGLNTLGAVFGVILAGFVTLRYVGEWNTIFIGVGINFLVAGISFLIYKGKLKIGVKDNVVQKSAATLGDVPISPYPGKVRRIVLISILISGFTALSYELIWTRQLILFLKTSIYAFSAMLAVFLIGIASGSILMNKFADKLKTPLVIFGILQLFIGILSIGNLYIFPFLDIRFLSRMAAPIILVFPLTFLFGSLFPVGIMCYAKNINKSASSVGMFYSFNTIGNVLGSLFTGFLLISLLGSTNTIIMLGFINILIGLIVLSLEPNKPINFKLRFLSIIPVIVFLSLGLKGKDPFLNTMEKRISENATTYEIFYHKETLDGTITAYSKNNRKGLRINGTGQTHLCTETKLMAHLPVMLANKPKKALAVCFGMGTTVKSFGIYDDIDITSVELVKEVYDCFGYFHPGAAEILNRKNLDLVVEDGRNFLLLSPDKYDIITVDPSPPIYSAGTVNLYTREFFLLCKSHLTPGGVMCLWFPENNAKESAYIIKTFYSVFPNTSVWMGPKGVGYYIIGAPTPIIDKSKIRKAFKNKKMVRDLAEYNDSCVTSEQLLNLLKWEKDDLKTVMEDALIVSDNFPHTEFPPLSRVFEVTLKDVLNRLKHLFSPSSSGNRTF